MSSLFEMSEFRVQAMTTLPPPYFLLALRFIEMSGERMVESSSLTAATESC